MLTELNVAILSDKNTNSEWCLRINFMDHSVLTLFNTKQTKELPVED